jgi:hypothetical protein
MTRKDLTKKGKVCGIKYLPELFLCDIMRLLKVNNSSRKAILLKAAVGSVDLS